MLANKTASTRAQRMGAVQPKAVLKTGTVSMRTAAKEAVAKNRFKQATGLPTPAVNGKQFPIKLGFTAENEIFVGRLAMLGFSSSLIGEILTGKGALAQFGYETGLNGTEVDGFIAFLVAFNLIAAILPTSQTFVPEEQQAVSDRPAGPLQDPRITLLEPKKFFGLGDQPFTFGWTKQNELLVGRVAQLGFAFSIIGELFTGKGPLAQFDFETGISLRDTEYGLLALIAFLLFAAVNPGSGKFVDEE